MSLWVSEHTCWILLNTFAQFHLSTFAKSVWQLCIGQTGLHWIRVFKAVQTPAQRPAQNETKQTKNKPKTNQKQRQRQRAKRLGSHHHSLEAVVKWTNVFINNWHYWPVAPLCSRCFTPEVIENLPLRVSNWESLFESLFDRDSRDSEWLGVDH